MNELSGDGRRVLDDLLARGGPASSEDVRALAGLDPDVLDAALAGFAAEHGAAAIPVLSALAERDAGRLRRAARRALYRLEQRGVRPAEPGPGRAVVAGRRAPRAVRAWMSGIDGTGSRAAWILFEADWGALRLCSLILNDVAGILEAAGGEVTKKRLDRELAALRASQKLPWVEVEPARAVGLVAGAMAAGEAVGTPPAAAFARWQPLFAGAAPAPAPAPPPAAVDEARVDRSAELLQLPELAGWFLDPEAVQGDALDRLQARESRLVVSDQIRQEREDSIVTRVVERELGPGPRRLWAQRLLETALVFDADARGEHAALARAAAAALLDEGRDAQRVPFARALVTRALDVADEVSAGRLRAADVSRRPTARHPA